MSHTLKYSGEEIDNILDHVSDIDQSILDIQNKIIETNYQITNNKDNILS